MKRRRLLLFASLSKNPTELLQDVKSAMPVLERFVVIMYDRASARKVLFAQKGRSLESIPPTGDALATPTQKESFRIWLMGTTVSNFTEGIE
ncbi:hypothetical protein OS493_038950, partial [Desmophyllum pertusum]